MSFKEKIAAARDTGLQIRDAHFPGRAPIDSYGNGGFRFADMSHRGSILILPSGIFGWSPDTDQISSNGNNFLPVFSESEDIDVLLIGTGNDIVPMDDELRQIFRDHNIIADCMSTGAAVRTLNVMLAEGRAVAAALTAVTR